MKKKRNPSKHVFILANKTTSSTLFYLFFVFNEKNRAHIDIAEFNLQMQQNSD